MPSMDLGTVIVEGSTIRVEPHAEATVDVDGQATVLTLSVPESEGPAIWSLQVQPRFLAAAVDAGIVRFTRDGRLLAVMAPPEVRDNAGDPVPVELVVVERDLRMLVNPGDRRSGQLTLKVWFGLQLIGSVEQGMEYGLPSYSIARTRFGHEVLGGGFGVAGARRLFEEVGWEQAVAVEPELMSAPSLRQQFDCHVLGAPAKQRWNLESARPDYPNWLTTALQHRCNWGVEDPP